MRVFREEHLRAGTGAVCEAWGTKRSQSRLRPVEIPGSRSREGEHKPMIPWQLADAAAAARKEKTHSIGAESKRDSKSENRMPLSRRLGRASRVGRRTTRNLIDSWNGNYPGSGRLLDHVRHASYVPPHTPPPVCLCLRALLYTVYKLCGHHCRFLIYPCTFGLLLLGTKR